MIGKNANKNPFMLRAIILNKFDLFYSILNLEGTVKVLLMNGHGTGLMPRG